jgi:hypothetical protein
LVSQLKGGSGFDDEAIRSMANICRVRMNDHECCHEV